MPGAREIIQPHKGDKRYIRRDERGRFTTDQSAMGRSLTRDRQQTAKRAAKAGYGDRRA